MEILFQQAPTWVSLTDSIALPLPAKRQSLWKQRVYVAASLFPFFPRKNGNCEHTFISVSIEKLIIDIFNMLSQSGKFTLAIKNNFLTNFSFSVQFSCVEVCSLPRTRVIKTGLVSKVERHSSNTADSSITFCIIQTTTFHLIVSFTSFYFHLFFSCLVISSYSLPSTSIIIEIYKSIVK